MAERPLMITTETYPKLPVLIVDKKGFLGKALTRILREQYLVVLVTAEEVEPHTNVIHIPYLHKIPLIPDNIYSHLFVVYNGEKEIVDMLPSFMKKAQESQAVLLFVTSLLHSRASLFTRLQTYASTDLHVFIYGETFANRQAEENEIHHFIHQARMYGRIEVPNNGLGRLYPILFDDVLDSLLRVAFGAETIPPLLYAFPQFAFTQIALARTLQKLNPLLKIDFKKQKHKPREFYIPSGGVFLFPQYDLLASLRQIDMEKKPDILPLPQKQMKLKVEDPEAQKRRLTIFMTLLFSLFVAPILLTFFLAISGAGLLKLSLSQAEHGNLTQAQQTATLSSATLAATETLLPSLILPSIFFPYQTDQVMQNIHTAREVVEIEQDGLAALGLLQNIYEDKSLDPKNDFLHALATLKNTLLTFQKMKAENKLPKPVAEKMEKYTGVLRLVEGTIDTWPALFGFEGPKTYMVLFQNNMELRPGGGFIGSYGILPVHNGKMEKLQIHDVYDADGRLKTHVEPPYGLQRYLGASHWFLRDSNFDVDFTKNANQAAQFLRLETGQDVDGVIAIDTTFLKDLLTVLGSVRVSDYKETVTPDNFYLLTQTHVEKGFFPGSTQKKDFLRSLTNAMQYEFFEVRKFSYEKLLQQVESSIHHKHLLAAFSDPGIQNVYTVNGLSSSLRDGRGQESNTLLDFFSVIDANVGANKANYYVKRSMSQEIRFDDAGALQTTAAITYTNTSAKGSPFGGDYKNYVRILLPLKATLQNVFIDNKQQEITPAITDSAIFKSKTFIPPSGLEVEQTEAIGKRVLGFFVIVPTGSTKTITLSYRLPKGVNLDDTAFSYKLRLFKQPGAADDPYTLSFSYPNTFKVIRTESGAVDLGGKFKYETVLDSDKDISVSLSKK